MWNQKLEPDTWGVVVEELWGHEEAAKLHTNSFGRRLTLQKHDLKSIGHLTQVRHCMDVLRTLVTLDKTRMKYVTQDYDTSDSLKRVH